MYQEAFHGMQCVGRLACHTLVQSDSRAASQHHLKSAMTQSGRTFVDVYDLYEDLGK